MTEKKTFFQKLAEILFVFYITSIYLFNSNSELVKYSNVLFVLFAGVAIIYFLQIKRFCIDKNILLTYLFCGWVIATYFWAENQYIVIVKMKTMWQIFLLFFIVYNLFYGHENAHEYILKSLYIAGLVLLGYSIWVYGIQGTISILQSRHVVRLGSEISQANVFGRQHATTVLVGFYYLIYKKRHKLFHIMVIAMSFLYSMSSGSRKALLTVCIGVLFLIIKRYGIKKVYKIIALLLVVTLLFVIVIQLPIFNSIRTRMEGTFETLTGSGGDGSSQTRLRMIKIGWDAFKGRILIGYGANNYLIVSNMGKYSHNNFIEILVCFGLIGFAIYYSIYIAAFVNLNSMKSDSGRMLLCVFLVRFLMEVAVVSYYDKTTWILLAFFMLKKQGDIKNTILEERNNENISGENEKSCIQS